MSRSARIGLIALALAIAVVGVGVVGMAFLPAAVTEPVVKPVTQSVELLTGDEKPEDRKSTRLNSSHDRQSRMPSSA